MHHIHGNNHTTDPIVKIGIYCLKADSTVTESAFFFFLEEFWHELAKY